MSYILYSGVHTGNSKIFTDSKMFAEVAEHGLKLKGIPYSMGQSEELLLDTGDEQLKGLDRIIGHLQTLPGTIPYGGTCNDVRDYMFDAKKELTGISERKRNTVFNHILTGCDNDCLNFLNLNEFTSEHGKEILDIADKLKKEES